MMKMHWKIFILMVVFIYKINANRNIVTNEDIRDAILQVVNVVRTTEDKLERHEFRERVLGDQLKKGIISLDKRLKMLDPSRGPISRLDQRLAAVETILIQKDERERVQLQKTYDTVEDIQKNLPTIVEKLKHDILEKIDELKTSMEPQTQRDSNPIISVKDFDDFKQDLNKKIDKVANSINVLETDLSKINEEKEMVKQIHNKSTENLENVKKHLDSNGELLSKFENKLSEYTNIKINEPQVKEQADWQTNFMKALDFQKDKVQQILDDVQSMSEKVANLPNKSEIENIQNTTLDNLEQIRQETIQQPLKSEKILEEKFNNIKEIVDQKHKETLKTITDMSEVTGSLTESFSNGYEQLKNEIQSISKIDQVMVQTADNVLDTKRRIEYGVHQILSEVGQLIKASSKDIGAAISERFDNFETSILDEDSGALANLTSKIGHEIDQVWRQIGIMHQQMSATGDTLNKLQNQTDAYVNGSLNVLDNMKGKVGRITGHITEVDGNLNYLVGKLSLITQQINLIKSGLGKALEDMKNAFKSVQDKVKDMGPGPHKINSNEIIDDTSSTTK